MSDNDHHAQPLSDEDNDEEIDDLGIDRSLSPDVSWLKTHFYCLGCECRVEGAYWTGCKRRPTLEYGACIHCIEEYSDSDDWSWATRMTNEEAFAWWRKYVAETEEVEARMALKRKDPPPLGESDDMTTTKKPKCSVECRLCKLPRAIPGSSAPKSLLELERSICWGNHQANQLASDLFIKADYKRFKAKGRDISATPVTKEQVQECDDYKGLWVPVGKASDLPSNYLNTKPNHDFKLICHNRISGASSARCKTDELSMCRGSSFPCNRCRHLFCKDCVQAAVWTWPNLAEKVFLNEDKVSKVELEGSDKPVGFKEHYFANSESAYNLAIALEDTIVSFLCDRCLGWSEAESKATKSAWGYYGQEIDKHAPWGAVEGLGWPKNRSMWIPVIEMPHVGGLSARFLWESRGYPKEGDLSFPEHYEPITRHHSHADSRSQGPFSNQYFNAVPIGFDEEEQVKSVGTKSRNNLWVTEEEYNDVMEFKINNVLRNLSDSCDGSPICGNCCYDRLTTETKVKNGGLCDTCGYLSPPAFVDAKDDWIFELSNKCLMCQAQNCKHCAYKLLVSSKFVTSATGRRVLQKEFETICVRCYEDQ